MKTKGTRRGPWFVALFLIPAAFAVVWTVTGNSGGAAGPSRPQAQVAAGNTNLQVYPVNRKVSDFPTNEDLSTPETAYANLSRLSASGDLGFWKRISEPSLAARMPDETGTRKPSQKAINETLNTKVVEVRVYSNCCAAVLAKVPTFLKATIDLRCFERVNGRWLNTGQDLYNDLEAARAKFARIVAFREAERAQASRPPIANPAEHLKPFVEFLEQEGTDPEAFVLRALAERPVVIMGEVHNRPRYWAFNMALVRSPEFARRAKVIYLEFPINDQPLMDRFLAAPENDPTPVIEMLRDMFENGWPDQPTVEFCQAVWEVNQKLPREQRLRIELVDMERPWKKIRERKDWRKYDVDRDAFMAKNILRDLGKHGDDKRHALFIVGWMHARKNLTNPGGDPIQSAGWHLQTALGATNVLAIFPHCPVMANRGEVNGRLGLGLFESAFAALTNRPMAFPLDYGPFGALPFDASMDFVTSDPYRAGFDAFLYLGPLEDEILSPLVPGFYTDEYAKEVDRRMRLMGDKGLAKVEGATLVQMRCPYWGKPRREWQALGPLNAWEYGSDWEKKLREAKHRNAQADAPAIKQAAERLIEAIRKADYERPGPWESFPSPDVDYTVHSDYPGWMEWVCRHFRTNPIVKAELGAVALDAQQSPGLNYTLKLQNGQTLEGYLPVRWNARAQCWGGVEGLDWHRR
ncbi:MAG TPA: hypothetical protein PK640_21015 [Verrucomicrobiota bacterium]|nr:hypothetical protein [Verrucomicrobiota bacterium]